MSSFFTAPASQRKKRRRTDSSNGPSAKRHNPDSAIELKGRGSTRITRDDSISGSESEDEIVSINGSAGEDATSESEYDGETAAEQRLRLAERYLDNIREEVDETVGFDAADIDRDLIAERLKEDVAETKGRLFRRIASNLLILKASHVAFRADTLATTAVAACDPYVYTVSKDITLIKWETPTAPLYKRGPEGTIPRRRRPKQLAFVKGNKNKRNDPAFKGHVDQILTVAASQDGRFVATGGKDSRLIVWNAENLKPLRVFTQHRDAVTGLVFRRGTNQLYSSSKDRTVKVWSLDDLAYIETLFGHQDEVVDVAALAQERCLSVGARDRTARLWKVVEETQLVFRGGSGEKKDRKMRNDNKNDNKIYAEGSMDRISMVDEDTFVTGSDNGSISLWSIHKKKPVFTLPTAHGLDPPLPPEEASAEQDHSQFVPNPPQPRWITALQTIPYADLILSGSWDGCVRAWKISEDKRRIESLGPINSNCGSLNTEGQVNRFSIRDEDASDASGIKLTQGVINDIAVWEKGDRGKEGIRIVVGVGSENRLGRWIRLKGKNQALIVDIPTGVVEDSTRNGD